MGSYLRMKTIAVLLLAVLPLCGSVDVVCSTAARSLTDVKTEVQCPAGCDKQGGRVWGTGIYTDDSSICLAAIHDGKIVSSGGKVIVEKKPGQSSYVGSTNNGVTTNSYGSWSASFVLTPVSSVMLQCPDKASSLSNNTTVVQCPAGCVNKVYSLWGTYVYTEDSPVCPAAIHAGVLPNSGGFVMVKKQDGQTSYQGASQNGLTSSSYGSYPRSFTFQGVDPNAAVGIQCSSSGNSLIADRVWVQCPSGCTTQSYFLWGTAIYTSDSSICPAAIHSGVISNSGGSVTVEKWPGQSSYQGSSLNGITSVNYGPYSTSFVFRVPAIKIQCGDQSRNLKSDRTIVRCPADCDKQSSSVWGTTIYTDDSSICRAAIHDSKIPNSGGLVTVEKRPGQSSYVGSSQNGITTSGYGSWSGSFVLMKTLAEVAESIDCSTRGNAFGEDNVIAQCPAGCATSSYSVWGTIIYTEDSSVCAAAIHAGVISNAGGAVTVEKRAGRTSYQSTSQNGITSSSYGSYPRSFSFHGLVSSIEMIQCSTRGNGFKEENVTLQCPTSCKEQVSSLWGTAIYTEDSMICAAAIHAGVISNSGGVVTVEKLPGQSSYQGSSQNGITSSNYGTYSKSFTFRGAISSMPYILRCSDNARILTGAVFEVECPENCGTENHPVWGTDIYTDDSSICRAAIHDGKLSIMGGTVTVEKKPGQSQYVGSSRNGITTISYGAFSGSFIFTQTDEGFLG